MKLRSKLSLGIGILFTLILIQGIQSIRYVRHLSVSSKEILSDNYNSVHYVSEMLRSLDRFSQDSASRRTLIEALTLQQQNITEINERQVTSALEEKVGRLNDSISGEEVQQIRNDLYRIMELNMGSILAKSRGMESSADEAVESYLDIGHSDTLCPAGGSVPALFSLHRAPSYRQAEAGNRPDRQP